MLSFDLAKGLDHLHNRPNPIVHGDLRPSNLLLGGSRVFNRYHKGLTNDEIGVLKIADFGERLPLHRPLDLNSPSHTSRFHQDTPKAQLADDGRAEQPLGQG